MTTLWPAASPTTGALPESGRNPRSTVTLDSYSCWCIGNYAKERTLKDPDEGPKDTEEGPTFKYTQEGPVRYCTEEEVRALGSRVITMYPTSMFMTEESPDESPVTEEKVSDDEAKG